MSVRPDLSDDAFDSFLRESLEARPVPAPAEDVALAAMTRARILEERAAKLAQLGRRLRFCSAAAGLLLAVALAATFMTRGNSTTSEGEAVSSQNSESTDTGSYAGVLLAAVVVGVFTKSLLSADRFEPMGAASPVA
jgi:hypothetical protein